MGMKSVDLIANVNNVGGNFGGLTASSVPPFSNIPHNDDRYYLEDDRLYYNYNNTTMSANNRLNNHNLNPNHLFYGRNVPVNGEAGGECPGDRNVELVGFSTFPRQNGYIDTYVCEGESGSEANSDTEVSHV
ncbi:hypothetical protein ElyMa_005719200 [Elysia marginata]|uniref:Uncharacterized protein n=1 Tax=Elysia marginata TaxID=1093978 RepID=A0AAV4FIX4_9GAST|nr:hypothetical protein ElyMa_005719200 [Elysia marginata]